MQYKFINSFVDVSSIMDDLGFPVEREYYGSEHGKGESDDMTNALERASLGDKP